MAALVLASVSHALLLFIISAILCGAAYSLLFACVALRHSEHADDVS